MEVRRHPPHCTDQLESHWILQVSFPSSFQIVITLTDLYTGNAFLTDTGNNRIRKVTVATSVITTMAGSGGTTGGYSGDGSAATSATLNLPSGVTVDSSGTHKNIML